MYLEPLANLKKKFIPYSLRHLEFVSLVTYARLQISFLYFIFSAKHQRVHILDTETFEDTFGKKSHRKRPRLATTALQV